MPSQGLTCYTFHRVTSQTGPLFFKMAPTGILVFFALSSLVVTIRSASLITTTPIGCVWRGQWYPEGQEFKPDPCTFCNCISGRPMCVVADCVIPSCVDYVQDPNQCCPSCPNGKSSSNPSVLPVLNRFQNLVLAFNGVNGLMLKTTSTKLNS